TPTEPPFIGVSVRGLFVGDGGFYLQATNQLGEPVLLVSDDGTSWSMEATDLPPLANVPMFRNGRYFASDPTTPSRLLLSPDARQWNSVTLPVETTVTDLAHGFGVYVAIGTGPH